MRKKPEKPVIISHVIRDKDGNYIEIDPVTHPIGTKIKAMIAELETGQRYVVKTEGA
jgi:hypothetical protein